LFGKEGISSARVKLEIHRRKNNLKKTVKYSNPLQHTGDRKKKKYHISEGQVRLKKMWENISRGKLSQGLTRVHVEGDGTFPKKNAGRILSR